MSKFIDMSNKIYNNWKVLYRIDDNNNGKKPTIMYKAICLLCGKEYEVRGVSVRNGTSQCCKSCSKSMSRKGKKIKNNIYIEKEDCYEMMLKNNKIVKFDKEDFNLINKYFWNTTNTNYVYTRYMGKWIYMHRLIMQKELNNKPQLDIDHINHNTLDNRKCNLRLATKSQNSMNRKSKGYYYDKRCNKYIVRIKFNNKTILIGRFENEKDAVKARKEAENKYYGEFAFK